jgi:hypothetical protein
MKATTVISTALATIALSIAGLIASVEGQTPGAQTRRERFTPRKPAAPEGPARFFYIEGITSQVQVPEGMREARTGFDNRINGLASQGPDFETIDEDNVDPLAFSTTPGSSLKKSKT